MFNKFLNKKKKQKNTQSPSLPKYSKIETKIFNLFKEKFREYDYFIEVICYEASNECIIQCRKNYNDEENEKQLICFDLILSIYETLGSKKINTSNISFKDGCYTSGYGAETNVTITVDDVDFSKFN